MAASAVDHIGVTSSTSDSSRAILVRTLRSLLKGGLHHSTPEEEKRSDQSKEKALAEAAEQKDGHTELVMLAKRSIFGATGTFENAQSCSSGMRR